MNRYFHSSLFPGLACLLCLFPLSAQAYIDPGTGSLLLQGLIGAVAGVMVAASLYWSKIKRFFRGGRGPGGTVDDELMPGGPGASAVTPAEERNGGARVVVKVEDETEDGVAPAPANRQRHPS